MNLSADMIGADLFIQALNTMFTNKNHEIIERLSEIGFEFASKEFPNAVYDGTNDVNVSLKWVNDNTVDIQASGASVLFIEFGTGVTYNPSSVGVEFGFLIGEYGKGQGKHKAWAYQGEPGTNGKPIEGRDGWILTRGNPANRIMYNASEEMKRRIEEVIKGVYGID